MPGTVTVGLKHPGGIKLQLQKPRDVKEYTIYGPLETKRWDRFGTTVLISGYNDKTALVRNGFALTTGVDAEFFEEWMKQNADSDLVANGFIYAAVKTPDVEAHARTYRDERCGFEAMDPKSLPDEFKRRIEQSASA